MVPRMRRWTNAFKRYRARTAAAGRYVCSVLSQSAGNLAAWAAGAGMRGTSPRTSAASATTAGRWATASRSAPMMRYPHPATCAPVKIMMLVRKKHFFVLFQYHYSKKDRINLFGCLFFFVTLF